MLPKLITTHNHHHHNNNNHHCPRRRPNRLLLQLVLKMLFVARAVFMRRNPGASTKQAEDFFKPYIDGSPIPPLR